MPRPLCIICNQREEDGEFTHLCNGCWELKTRVESQPDLAIKILVKLIPSGKLPELTLRNALDALVGKPFIASMVKNAYDKGYKAHATEEKIN